MNGYEFMAQNPVLTIILFLIVAVTITEVSKHMFGYLNGDRYEQATSESERRKLNRLYSVSKKD